MSKFFSVKIFFHQIIICLCYNFTNFVKHNINFINSIFWNRNFFEFKTIVFKSFFVYNINYALEVFSFTKCQSKWDDILTKSFVQITYALVEVSVFFVHLINKYNSWKIDGFCITQYFFSSYFNSISCIYNNKRRFRCS